MRRLLMSLALLLTVGFLAAACDDDGDGDAGVTPTAATPAETPDETPADSGDVDELGLPIYPPAPPPADGSSAMGTISLQWWGQSAFLLGAAEGVNILIDPYKEGIGYQVPDVDADVTTISHDHADHSNADAGSPELVLRGLTEDGWAQVGDRSTVIVRIRSVPSWHDDFQGGRNSIFVFETAGLHIVHLGDLGHALTQAQMDAIGRVDVLLVPVGGFFTIDAAEATDVVQQLSPRVVIPMHYKTDSLRIPQLEPVDAFLEGKEVVDQGSTVELNVDDLPAPGSAVVWVMQPEGAEE